MRLGGSSRTVIGVDVGRRTIKAAQLVRSRGRWHAFALAMLPRPEPEKETCGADAAALHKVLRRQGFSGKKIVVAAPEERTLQAALELPSKVSGAPMGQIVRMEMSRLHNVAPDSFEMAYWELRTPDSAKPVVRTFAVGCPHDAGTAVMDVFESEGFDVTALDVRGAAAVRACEPLILPVPQITAIADLGWCSTSVLFVCGRSLMYERRVAGASIGELTARLAEVFGITLEAAQQIVNTVGLSVEDPAGIDHQTLDVIRKHVRNHFDKMLEEWKAPFSYVNHQYPAEGLKQLLLIGGGAAVPQIAPYVQERLGLSVRTVAAGDLIESPAELLAKAQNPALTVAVGLAQFGGPADE